MMHDYEQSLQSQPVLMPNGMLGERQAGGGDKPAAPRKPRCPRCGKRLRKVHAHGKTQCAACGQVLTGCCE